MRFLLAALALSAFCALFNAQSPSTAHAYTTYSIVNSNAQYPLYDEGSTKLAAVRCYAMKYNPCGYDCVGDTCTRVHQAAGISCPYVIKAKNCRDNAPPLTTAGDLERWCAMNDQNGASLPDPIMTYTLHENYPEFWNNALYPFPRKTGQCDINAQVLTLGL
jgi:hypothetical protein